MDQPGEQANQTLQQRMEAVESRIRAACARSGRNREDVQVVAVTKYVSVETAQAVLARGQQHLGESRWPDAREKLEQVGADAIWHFIGNLQTRKVRHVVGRFSYIHSLDRLSLAEEIEKRAAAASNVVSCFAQVNVSGEASKSGLKPEEVESFVQKLKEFPHIRLVGLMTMAPHVEQAEQVRPVFRRLRQLRDQLNEQTVYNESIPHLSMGMSNDFEVAIEEGATWVRLGSTLVGKNNGSPAMKGGTT